MDEFYDFLFVNGLCKGGGLLLGSFDRNVVDGGVNGAGWLTRFTLRVSMWWDTWIIDGVVRLGILREDALLPRVHSAKWAGADLCVFFVVGGVLVMFGYFRRCDKPWTSIY